MAKGVWAEPFQVNKFFLIRLDLHKGIEQELGLIGKVANIISYFLTFSEATAPEISFNGEEILDGLSKRVYRYNTTRTISPITLRKGRFIGESFFEYWYLTDLSERYIARRDFILINYHKSFYAWGWVLKDCKVTRIKLSDDFNASEGDIAVKEIEIQPNEIILLEEKKGLAYINLILGMVRQAINLGDTSKGLQNTLKTVF